MARIFVSLKSDVGEALWRLAIHERRDPRDQAALIIERELERAGLLPESAKAADLPAEATDAGA